jgi:hypothetical protein
LAVALPFSERLTEPPIIGGRLRRHGIDAGLRGPGVNPPRGLGQRSITATSFATPSLEDASFFTLSKRKGASFRLKTQKGRDARIFQAQDRAIDDFTLKGKPRNGSIDKF